MLIKFLGGYLGAYCQHAYAHSTPEGGRSLPAVLKGSDMSIYEVFLALGLHVAVRPVLEKIVNLEENNKGYYSDSETEGEMRSHDFVGKELGNVHFTDCGGCEETMLDIYDTFPHDWLAVTWLTPPKWEGIGMAHLAVSIHLYKFTFRC